MSPITLPPPLPTSFVVFVRRINNPLCVITLACDLLNVDDMDVEQKKYVDMIRRAVRRISREMITLLPGETGN